jgi:hypothetical protein
MFMLKSNVDTSIDLDTIMCANWLIDWLLKVQQAIFQSYSGWEKFVNKKSERGDSGMGQHGQRLNTGTCFSVSSDDKLVLFLFPGILMGNPAYTYTTTSVQRVSLILKLKMIKFPSLSFISFSIWYWNVFWNKITTPLLLLNWS